MSRINLHTYIHTYITDRPTACEENAQVLENFNNSVTFEEKRYQVMWPWKSEQPSLPTNFGLAMGRMKSLIRRFKDSPLLFTRYKAIIDDQMNKGIIELVTADMPVNSGLMHYLPHQPVITPQKTTTKLRIVYDASSKSHPSLNSLNDCLHRGPVILPDLCGLLLNFRLHEIGLLADVEKAFLQVGLQQSQRDVTRFLWVQDYQKSLVAPNLLTYRFARVPFGMTSSPFLLGATLLFHLEKQQDPVLRNLSSQFYVDNLVASVPSLEEATHLIQTTVSSFAEMSMNIRGWDTNSTALLKKIPLELRSGALSEKVLGVLWHTEPDTLQFSKAEQFDSICNTKREVLQLVANVFDPMGLIIPVTVTGKMFLQILWKDSLDWDTPLPENHANKWTNILANLQQLPSITLPRWIGYNSSDKYQMHVFVDASPSAYSAAVYLRIDHHSHVTTHLLFAKSRVAPVKKPLTVPRLELMGMIIGSRTGKFVKQYLPQSAEQHFLWSDSACNLQLLINTKPQEIFVKNRLKELRSTEFIFRHVPSIDNPADCATHGITVPELQDHPLWWHGPPWLKQTSAEWPTSNVPIITPEMMKIVIPGKSTEGTFTIGVVTCKPTTLLSAEKFSTLLRLLRTTAYFLRFLSMVLWSSLSSETKAKLKERYSGFFNLLESCLCIVFKGSLTAEELNNSTTWWIYQVQRQFFPEVFHALRNKKKHPLIQQLNLQLDEKGILRAMGRLSNMAMPFDSKFPILLPRNAHLTGLIIHHHHEKLLHQGVKHTLTSLRQQYWIPRGRQEVRKILHDCMTCRKHEGGPFALPEMGQLPACRVQKLEHPFKNVGLDYAGPFYVLNHPGAGEKMKVWICLFTCTASRALHLELVMNLTTEAFLRCLRRFIARRGQPSKIICDNAPHFLATQKVLAKEWELTWEKLTSDPAVKNYCSNHQVKFSTIPAYSPWTGGFYERLIGLTKSCLKKSVGRKLLTVDQLYTLVTEIEAVLITRTLTHVYADHEHLLILRPVVILMQCANYGAFPVYD